MGGAAVVAFDAAIGVPLSPEEAKTMFERRQHERQVRQVLRKLGRQYVKEVTSADRFLIPSDRPRPEGPVLVIREAFIPTHEDRAAIETCLLRGWAEIVHEKKATHIIPNEDEPVMGPTWPA